MHPKDNIPPHWHQDVVYWWTCPEEACNSSYIRESRRCLENRIKEHNTSTNNTIYQKSSTHNHPKADISHFKTIDQDNKQIFRKAREAIHIRRINPVPNHNISKMYILNIFNQLLETINNPSTYLQIQISSKILPQSTASGLLEQSVCLVTCLKTPLVPPLLKQHPPGTISLILSYL